MTVERASVVNLEALVADLPGNRRQLFERLFRIASTTGRLQAPPSMHKWIEGLFGSVAAVEHQKIVKVTNRVTLEESLYNELRARRPIETREAGKLTQVIEEARGGPFSRPLEGTPEDVFGRIKGQYCITASNVAKYDGFHGVVVFDEFNPLTFSQDQVVDYLDTSRKWIEAAHASDPGAVYPFIMWNCLWKSGASIVHGHFQVTLGRGTHYGKIDGLRQQALGYRNRHGANYFDDLWAVHQSLGLGLEWSGVRIFPYLVPVKEKETLIIAPGFDESLKLAIYKTADCFVHKLGVTSFNMAVYMPPLTVTGEDWTGFPTMVRLVDRGDPLNKTADVGAMELYAASVVSSDPFRVADALKESFA